MLAFSKLHILWQCTKCTVFFLFSNNVTGVILHISKLPFLNAKTNPFYVPPDAPFEWDVVSLWRNRDLQLEVYVYFGVRNLNPPPIYQLKSLFSCMSCKLVQITSSQHSFFLYAYEELCCQILLQEEHDFLCMPTYMYYMCFSNNI